MNRGNNYRAWDIEPLKSETAAKKDLYLNLVGWAILAASTHNVQPWRFIVRLPENIIDISLDKTGILPVSDKTGRQAYISIGCAAENLLLAAEYYGLKPKWSTFLIPCIPCRPFVSLSATGKSSNSATHILLLQ